MSGVLRDEKPNVFDAQQVRQGELKSWQSIPAGQLGNRSCHAMLKEAFKRIGDRPAYLQKFKENARTRLKNSALSIYKICSMWYN